MKVDAPATTKDQSSNEDIFLEVFNTEKQLFAAIHSKGLLNKNVQDLYCKVRAGYEYIILNDHDNVELQEVEYFLWKLHYKHIDEFRKRIRPRSTTSECVKAETLNDDPDGKSIINRYMEGFKTFLSQAAEFYTNLITKFKRSCGLPEELMLYNYSGSSISVELTKVSKCQHACHRFLICLGDLERYSELCKKQDSPQWSVAFTYYLEATKICPASGNPHNQLALLAKYVGDAFLALYHCIRSLAVKEPFPDAWNNLMLLFEENRSSHLRSLSSEGQLDFLKPSELISLKFASHLGTGSSDYNTLDATNSLSVGKCELWPLLIRMTSFFLARSSLEDFQCTLSSTIKNLEAMVVLDDDQLKSALESYKLLDSSRRGPYRALQLISILIFIIDNLTANQQREKPNEKDNELQSALTEMALVTTFICIARLLERCLADKQGQNCPLLPALLVFVEWLVGAFKRVEAYTADEKVSSAISYFFDALADLLNRLGLNDRETSLDNTALWEDHELRGFEPVAHAQACLEFTIDQEWPENFNSRNLRRSQRIFHAGMKLVNKSKEDGQWIIYERRGKRFYTARSIEVLGQVKAVGASNSTLQVAETEELICRTVNLNGKESPEESELQHSRNHQSVTPEEEEVILFKPIMRHNSEPLYRYLNLTNHVSADRKNEQTKPADECLRRAASMFTWQNQAQNDGSNFHFDATNSRNNKSFKQQEPFLKDSGACPAGPPSLSAWVFDTERSKLEKGIREFGKHELSPIQDFAPESFSGLSINETKVSVVDSVQVSAATNSSPPPTYIAPVPSAPLLPDDVIWFRGNSAATREGDGILGAPPVSQFSNGSASHGPLEFGYVLPGLVVGNPPQLGMSSSEWLYHYRNNHKLEQTNYSHLWPIPLNGPGPISSFLTNDISRFDLYNPWGNHLAITPKLYTESPQLYPGSSHVYSAEEQRRDNLLLGYQRSSSPYVCAAAIDTRPEQQQLLQYLKDREWQLQREPPLRGSDFTGN